MEGGMEERKEKGREENSAHINPRVEGDTLQLSANSNAKPITNVAIATTSHKPLGGTSPL